MIKSIQLSNFLSFGNKSKEINLHPLNIIIGTNGSGKSNFLEAFDILKNVPNDIAKLIREGGGILDWMYKGSNPPLDAVLDFVVSSLLPNQKYNELQYMLSFNVAGQGFEIVDEKILSKQPDLRETRPYIFYDFDKGKPVLNIQSGEMQTGRGYRNLQREDVNMSQSILAQKRDTFHYPEITHLAQEFDKIRVYREWNLGRYTPVRLPQKADLPNQYLEPDCSNLGLVLSEIGNDLPTKKRLLKELQYFYNDVEDYNIKVVAGTVQIFFQEQGLVAPVPATRLSDGTLRYLCLLAILFHPSPPRLVCIEEPELGLHPDILPHLGELLIEASERFQLIVTTHSEILVDSFHDMPEAILVAEKTSEGTQLNRLQKYELAPWLEKYRLGELWSRGDIGGNRW